MSGKTENAFKIVAYVTGALAMLTLTYVFITVNKEQQKLTKIAEASTTPVPVFETPPPIASPKSTPTPAVAKVHTPTPTPRPVAPSTPRPVAAATPKPAPPATGVPSATKQRQFRYKNPDAKAVAIIGSFNNWKPEPLTMDKNGFWFIDKTLPRGVPIEYQYIVDGVKIPDPWGLIPSQDNGDGTKKSVYTIPLVDPPPPKPRASGAPVETVDIAALSNNPAEWPPAVTLKKEVNFPAVTINGKTNPEFVSPISTHATLKKVEPDQLTIEFRGSVTKVPIADTDLVERILNARAH